MNANEHELIPGDELLLNFGSAKLEWKRMVLPHPPPFLFSIPEADKCKTAD